jgi:hypothetical protein
MSTVCRTAGSGLCDVAENCTGTSGTCPADRYASSATVCRAASGTCDVAETCTGASATCPADAFASSSTVCRGTGTGLCDAAENCTGSSAACPPDVGQPDGTSCGTCTVCASGTCTGFATLGSDPGDDCPLITCTNYLYGWSGNNCARYSGSSTNNGMCNGAGACASITQSCSGAGLTVLNGSCNEAGCRDTSLASPCRAGLPAPSFTGPCNYDGGPCYCDCVQHGCGTGRICNEPNGRCLTGCV